MLYRKCAREFQWTPEQVDGMEVWQVGAALGTATEALEAWAQSRTATRPTPAASSVPLGERDLVAERVRASKGEGPPVEPDAMPLGDVMALQERLRGG